MCRSIRLTSIPLLVGLIYGVTTVSCQDKVQVRVGRSAVLPCAISQTKESVSVHWRDQGERVVLDIIDNTAKVSNQHKNFRDRVQSFPDQYNRGNFSIVLTKVQMSDNGSYDCHIPKVDFQRRVYLTVTGERDTITLMAGNEPTRNSAVMLHTFFLTVLLPSLLLLFTDVHGGM